MATLYKFNVYEVCVGEVLMYRRMCYVCLSWYYERWKSTEEDYGL